MALTLSTSLILELCLDAFKTRVPFLANAFSTDFSDETAKLNQPIKARIASLPTVQDYDATGGYKTNAAETTALLNDVDVTISRHKHVPIKLDFLDANKAVRNISLLEEATSNCGFALAKSMVDYALSLVLAANFSENSIYSAANSDLDALINVREDMNAVGASPMGRFGIVNSPVMSTLTADSRIASGDFHGQRIGADAYGHLQNIQGFQNIWEYPDMPANAENLTGFFGTKGSIIIASRLPNNPQEIAKQLGITSVSAVDVITDEDTGLSLMGITWQEAGTFDVYYTVVVMYGAAAGKQGGSAGDLTDYAGHRLITA